MQLHRFRLASPALRTASPVFLCSLRIANHSIRHLVREWEMSREKQYFVRLLLEV